jgi:glycosyltransferase involved in cell wall biosynthesis
MLVLTSYREGMPLVLLEAKANKLPCISFDVITGPNEIILDKVNGVLIKPDETDAMARAINELINNEALRCSYSEHAYDNIQMFSEETITKENFDDFTKRSYLETGDRDYDIIKKAIDKNKPVQYGWVSFEGADWEMN